MELHVTTHAVKRYRERMCDYSSTDKQIVDMLKRIARRGIVASAKSGSGGCLEVGYQGISIVLGKDGKHATVITCLGDASYRQWSKRQSLRNLLRGKVRYRKTSGFR